ncbi:ethylene-responsive transcription factor ERF003 [Gossypium australe]|uniref:Ethylene-responsive transcription factor ERF003 n=1 Tax=Gossypium australe TaxID=47621 RepID=A0A5B6WWG4_9ROSI|nr:ethylene-responsive transcription factor ERF003 [Gossypium australe]
MLHFYRKTRIWLGTFEMVEDTAYVWIMAAKTNFSYNPTALQSSSSSSKLLSATLTAKLHKCYMVSLQMTKQQSGQGTQNKAPTSTC